MWTELNIWVGMRGGRGSKYLPFASCELVAGKQLGATRNRKISSLCRVGSNGGELVHVPMCVCRPVGARVHVREHVCSRSV